MPGIDLFTWWALSISGGSVFLTLVGIYLYRNSRMKRKNSKRPTKKSRNFLRDFIFVWVLLGLLIFYIIAVNMGSAAIFAAGNILVEIILLLYLIRNRTEKTEEE